MPAAVRVRELGSLVVSEIGLGCNNFGRRLSFEDSRAVVNAALECGVDFFDTADRYGYGDHPFSGLGVSEQFLGRALGQRRSEVVIATKFGNPMSDSDPTMAGASPAWVARACEDSLRRLGTDYIDLYQIHQPDPTTPIDETLGALTLLVESGKVREIGCSNFSAKQLLEANERATALGTSRFVSIQNEYSLLVRGAESGILPVCAAQGVAFIPYFPLASGLLTGKYRVGSDAPPEARLATWMPRDHFGRSEKTMAQVEELIQFAEARGHTILELAFSWLLANPLVASVVAGATTPQQVGSNVASTTWRMSVEESDALASIEHRDSCRRDAITSSRQDHSGG